MKTSHPFSNASWDDVRLFLAALDHGSFTDAAKALGVGQATMSRRVAALEAAVGHALFDRSRGGLSPTRAAQQLRPWAEAMGAAMRDAGATLAGLEAAPEGRVRLACPPGVAVDFLPPMLKRLRVQHPKLLVEVLADVRVRDLAAHEADVAIRSVAPTGGPLLVRKLCDAPVGLFAAAELVRRLPTKARLEHVPLIGWSDDVPALRAALAAIPCPRVMETNEFLTMCAAAEAGVGAIVTTAVQAKLRGLVEVPVAFPPVPPSSFLVVTHQALRQVPRVVAVIDALEALIAGLGLASPGGVSRSPSHRRKGTSPSLP
jgi:DNA-binding transcriptional LysR family regulator